MKAIAIILISVLIISCERRDENTNAPTNTTGVQYVGEFKTIEVDSCEYITCSVYDGNSITHKGNCKYCAKRNKLLPKTN